MHPLGDAQRRRLRTWSALLCAIPLCLAPLAGRSSFELASEQAAFDARFAAAPQNVWSDKPVAVARDPFVPEPPAPTLENREPMTATGVVGVHVRQGDSMGFALPANTAAAATRPGENLPGIVAVTAIVTGPSPHALVDDGEHVRVVGVGDMLAGSRVLAIDGSGIRLQNGTLLTLTEKHL